jgi:hypothetical protein
MAWRRTNPTFDHQGHGVATRQSDIVDHQGHGVATRQSDIVVITLFAPIAIGCGVV